ncbi:MAG: hypothetical protein K1X53_17155 [Candidatus Sumerlaeaceae bacterium]|nr:hypothetical protein [Candidatus Sumerlaeaceae bacterium]
MNPALRRDGLEYTNNDYDAYYDGRRYGEKGVGGVQCDVHLNSAYRGVAAII